MKSYAKYIALSLMAVLCFSLLAGCSSSSTVAKLEPQEGVVSIVLTGGCTAEVTDNMIKVTLQSNLMQGTVVRFTIDSYDGTELAYKQYAVSGDNIYAEFERGATYPDIVYASVVASPTIGSQPDEVKDAYGRYFQNIDGEHIIWNGAENIFIVQSDKIVLS